MDRRVFLGIVAGALVSTPVTAAAQQNEKVFRVALVFSHSPVSVMTGSDPAHPHARGFLQGLRDRGYVEGRNIIIERRSGEGSEDRLREVMTELIRLRVDVIVAATNPVARAARQSTGTIPIVCVCDPVAAGLATSHGRPGGNVTGISNSPTVALAGKLLGLLKDAVPKISRVAALHSSATDMVQLEQMVSAARALDVRLTPVSANHPSDFDQAFATILRERADGLIMANSGLNYSVRRQIADFALQNHLPTVHAQREFTESGGLMSYGADLPDVYRRIGGYVDKILKGAKPADLPVQQPTKFELVINLKTAKALGLTIPPSLLQRADQFIE